MTKFFKAFMAFVMLCSFSQVTLAGPPTISCGTYRVAQGEQCNAFRQAYDHNGNPIGGIQPMQYINENGGQYVNGGQISNDMMVLQQLLASQQASAPGLAACGWTTAGAIVGATLGSLNTAYRPQAMILAGLLGGALGNAVCEDRRRQAQAEAMQIAQLQTQIRSQQMGQMQPQQVANIQQVGQRRNGCEHAPGTAQGVLNLPGDSKNGQTVCAKPGDPNIIRWL